MIVFYCIILFEMYACNNSSSNTKVNKAEEKTTPQATNTESNSSGDNKITFKVGGQTVTTDGWAISRYLIAGQNGVSITSNMHQDPKTVSINVNTITPGTYPFSFGVRAPMSPNVAYGSYRPDFLKQVMNMYNFQSGSVTIISVDTVENIVNLTFNGTGKNKNGEEVEITDGKVINGKLKPGVISGIR